MRRVENSAPAFAALIIATFMGVLDSTIVNIALPDITSAFHTTLNDSAWVTTVYIMALAVFMITASKLADQFGRKRVMLIGLAVFGAGSALCGFTATLPALIAMRVLQGLGGAVIAPVVMPMLLELFDRSRVPMVASVVGAVTGLAAAGGPPLGGVLLQYGSWRAIFFVNIPFAVLAFVLILFCTKESYDRTVSRRVDFAGMALLTACIFLLSFALLKGNDFGWDTPLVIGMFTGSAVSGALFFAVERRSRAPMVELHLFREKTFTFSSLCYLMAGFGMVAAMVVFNFYLQNIRGYKPLEAAFVVMFASVTVIAAMPLGSFIAKKWDARPVNFIGILLMGAGSLLYAFVGADTSRAVMIADTVVTGAGLGFAGQTMVSAIKHLPQEKSGIASGVVNAARQIGTCIGVALLVSLLDLRVADTKTDLLREATQKIDRLSVPDTVKTTAVRDLGRLYAASDTAAQTKLRKQLETDVRQAMAAQAAQPGAALLRQAGGDAQQAEMLAAQQMKEQASQMQSVLAAVSADAKTQVDEAFHGVFRVSAVVLIATSVLGLFSDRRKAARARESSAV